MFSLLRRVDVDTTLEYFTLQYWCRIWEHRFTFSLQLSGKLNENIKLLHPVVNALQSIDNLISIVREIANIVHLKLLISIMRSCPTGLWHPHLFMPSDPCSSRWLIISLQGSTRIINIWISKFPRSFIVRNLTCSCGHHFTMGLPHISMSLAARIVRFIVNCNNHIVLMICLLLIWWLSFIRVTSFIWPGMLDSTRDRCSALNSRVIMMSGGINACLLQDRHVNQGWCFRGVSHLRHYHVLGRIEYHPFVLQKVSDHLLLVL